MRIQVIKANGKTLGEFCSIKDVARVIRIPLKHVRFCLLTSHKLVCPKRKFPKSLGTLWFYEIDETKKGVC